MLTCTACGGLTPNLFARQCLHCDAELPHRRRRRLAMLLGPAGAVLLAACYGPPGRFYGPQYGAQQAHVDKDADGATDDVDCDDNDPTRYPGAADPDGDGIDQNCDGVDGWRDKKSTIAAPADGGQP